MHLSPVPPTIRSPRTAVLCAFLLLAGCGGPPLPGTHALAELEPLITGDESLALLYELAPLQRIPGTPGYDAALDRIGERLREGGFVAMDGPPPDGPPSEETPAAGSFILSRPMALGAWQPGDASLEVIGPDGFVVADTRQTPMALGLNSGATPPEGIVTRILNLGNGTYPAEYEGRDVRGALVYGRQPLQEVYRAAVLEYGALGAVSPAAPSWQGTEGSPGLVALGRAGSDGFGFKISPAMAARLEDAMNRAGGTLRVRARVDARQLEPSPLRTLVARIKGLPEGEAEGVLLIAPFSGPAPGAEDVSGAAALVEAAVALNRAIQDGRLERPRRSIFFLWGAVLDGTETWKEQYPRIAEDLHSATVVQLVARGGPAGGPRLLFERVPDPGAVWTRPPDEHTPWGASAPPSWPFEGHYLSVWSERLARKAFPDTTGAVVSSVPYEGGSDHLVLLEERVPAQRLWYFPDPYYHSSLDLADRADKGVLGAAARIAAALTWQIARAEPSDMWPLLDLIEGSARRKLSESLAQADRNLAAVAAADTSRRILTRSLEEDVVNAWKIWYLEAIESVLSHPMGPEAAPLSDRIIRAVGTMSREWDAGMRAVGLRPRPLPDRFKWGRRGVVK